MALTAASAPAGIGVGVSPRGPRAPHSRVHTGRFFGKEKRRFQPLRTGPYWGSSPCSGTLRQGPEGHWVARCPPGDLEICSLLNAVLSCFVSTPCPAWGCGCPHAGAPPHRGWVGDTPGTRGLRHMLSGTLLAVAFTAIKRSNSVCSSTPKPRTRAAERGRGSAEDGAAQLLRAARRSALPFSSRLRDVTAGAGHGG